MTAKAVMSIAALAAAIVAIPALAEERPAQECAGQPAAALPPALAGWARRTPLSAAGDRAALSRAQLPLGAGVDATLLSTPAVRYPLQPEKPGGGESRGGLFQFIVADAGNYRVALGAGAWIDVVGNGKPLRSIAHGHGPACSGIKKMVDFTLSPGKYVLQISGNGAAGLPLMVARLQ